VADGGIRDAATTPARGWGAGCTSWDLLDGPDLRVTQEHMPPGTAEIAHVHHHARQFFLVLTGTLVVELAGAEHVLGPCQGLEVPPGTRHRVRNDGPGDAEFVVTAAPTTRGDREDAVDGVR
jgi:mannose-6-phosphate isomerase-like protein (cupin superfamily)